MREPRKGRGPGDSGAASVQGLLAAFSQLPVTAQHSCLTTVATEAGRPSQGGGRLASQQLPGQSSSYGQGSEQAQRQAHLQTGWLVAELHHVLSLRDLDSSEIQVRA